MTILPRSISFQNCGFGFTFFKITSKNKFIHNFFVKKLSFHRLLISKSEIVKSYNNFCMNVEVVTSNATSININST